MVLLRQTADGVRSLFEARSAVDQMTSNMVMSLGRRPSPAEARSWNASVPTLMGDLIAGGLGNVEVLLEFKLPLTSKRADVVLAGLHPRTKVPSYVIIELKQWSSMQALEEDGALVHVPGYGESSVLDPLAQVVDYRNYLLDFIPKLSERPDCLSAVAYLHNATDSSISASPRGLMSPNARVFTGQRKSEFLDFLKGRLDPGENGADAADQLLGMAHGPARGLLALAAEEIRTREQFVLLDEQHVAYELVLREVAQARASNTKSVIVVTGGPGTGKSVIALSLLGELSRQGRQVLHATGSRSFTQTLRTVAGRGSTRVKGMFKYFNSFIDAEPNSLDVLILDEAHRIRETSANRFTRATHRTGRAQLDELMSVARVPVFLLDEHQVVRPGELGTVDDIRSWALEKGLKVQQVSLEDQFRCGGSEAYVRWVQRLLELHPGGPLPWVRDETFEVRVVDSPQEMESLLELKNQNGLKARMTAGYCWPWSDPRNDQTLVNDVVIDSWSHPWNVKGDRSVGGLPPAPLWASDPAGFSQVGCVYTAQGFEYDWNGVIIGPDLVWRSGSWTANRAKNSDPDFRNTRKVSDEEFDRLVRNVYKVLLTRGMAGTIIYSTDPETRQMLRSLVPDSLAV